MSDSKVTLASIGFESKSVELLCFPKGMSHPIRVQIPFDEAPDLNFTTLRATFEKIAAKAYATLSAPDAAALQVAAFQRMQHEHAQLAKATADLKIEHDRLRATIAALPKGAAGAGSKVAGGRSA